MPPDSHMDMFNGAVRFLVLELGALWGILIGSVDLTGNWVVAVFVTLIAMTVWARFRVPDDPGPAPRPVSGSTRLVIEAAVLGAGAAGLWIRYGMWIGVIYLVVVAVHYATTGRRLRHVLAFRP